MIQDIIVLVLVIAALARVGYQLSKIIFLKKKNASTCGGCSQCELKKTLVHHAE